MPMIAESDAQAMQWTLRACGDPDPASLRVIHIRNTLRLDELAVSPRVLDDLKGREDIEVLGPPRNLLDTSGRLETLSPI